MILLKALKILDFSAAMRSVYNLDICGSQPLRLVNLEYEAMSIYDLLSQVGFDVNES